GSMTAVSQPEFALDAQVAHGHGDEFLARQLFLDAHARNEGEAHSHADKFLDGFNGGQLCGDLERRLMAGEGFNDALAVRRRNVMRDELLPAELANADSG